MLCPMRLNKHLQQAYNKSTANNKPNVPARKSEEPARKPETVSFEKTTVSGATLLKLIQQDDSEKRPSLREIAGFLLLMGKDEAAKILALLPDDLIEKISLEISKIDVLRPEESREIISRFHIAATAELKKLRGGRDFARELLEKSVGKDRATYIMNRAVAPASFDHLDFLNELEAAQLRQLLREEPPRLIGVILSHLEAQLGAELLKQLPNEIKPQIIHSMRERMKLSQDTLQSIAKSLKEKIRNTGTHESEDLDGPQVMAEILRNMDASSERSILEELATEAPAIQAQIKERLFTIEQVLHIRDSDFQHILADMGDEEIALLMKGKDEEIRQRFLHNVSSQRGITISETYHFMGPIRRGKVDEATRNFIHKLRILEEKGKIVIYRDDDEMVE